jgi:multidrug efflux pump subunit AcrA (membrane-fusion protein)
VIATGVIAADPQLQAEVVAPMWGRIEFAHQPLSVGDRVNKGDELARLVLELPIGERYAVETRRGEIAAALDQARKRKELVDLDYRRAVALFRLNHDDLFRKRQVEWTEEIYRSAVQEETTIAAQSAAFANVITRRDPKITVVTAPLAGTIADIAFTPGELDETQQFRRLFTIVDLSRVWIVADVFEKDIEAIRTCRSASFTPAGGTAHTLGLPLVIADSLDEKTRTLRVIFQVPNPSGSLRLGAFASLIFDIE